MKYIVSVLALIVSFGASAEIIPGLYGTVNRIFINIPAIDQPSALTFSEGSLVPGECAELYRFDDRHPGLVEGLYTARAEGKPVRVVIDNPGTAQLNFCFVIGVENI